MSDAIKHECGIALLQLKKPLSFYKEKYGSSFYGINKMYLLMEKQHNRGQDGAGFASIKFDMSPGQRYISRVRSADQQPIQKIFKTINTRIQKEILVNPKLTSDPDQIKAKIPYVGELMLGHVRYGTFGKNNIESVHPFLRQNNWMHRNLIVAGNFNLTNVNELFENLVDLGQHPKEKADTITVMEKIGHFLDDAVSKIYKKLRKEGYTKKQASPLIAERLKISKILRKASKNWDGGYAMAGLLGHGDSFVLRDPVGIRPVYFYQDDEVVVVASERPVIQTVFNVSYDQVQELEPGHALINKKAGDTSIEKIIEPQEKRACSFERIYFSRGGDAEIYQERKDLGKALFPLVHRAIGGDLENSVFSFIPNTAETSFYGLIGAVQDHVRDTLHKELFKSDKPDSEALSKLLSLKPRIEKIAIKDAKLRTFITEDSDRDDLVAHVYDITYGVVKSSDNLVIIDDSIVRGTTLQKSILRMLDRLGPKKIVVVSSAPQIRYPDCYGIDMAKLEEFIAFRAALSLLQDDGVYDEVVQSVYDNCKQSLDNKETTPPNHVKAIYERYSTDQISSKISTLLKNDSIDAEVEVIFQTVEGLHKACPKNLGDWYFTGNYPTPGGRRVVNKAFVNFVEKNDKRAY
ncbi:amidophosphoribosyltransferase [Flavobacteriaceae bacterium]|nr:amidophosphoribosyltransferase [Flavobacteriaceae bacterium]MDB3862933.1 amidophosphoribosyltransferase [Flavobacteriaceae bacterium]MDC3354652.1 amidophosphoribosyltransferase [Flavobacteriaceae bacterium]